MKNKTARTGDYLLQQARKESPDGKLHGPGAVILTLIGLVAIPMFVGVFSTLLSASHDIISFGLIMLLLIWCVGKTVRFLDGQ